MGRIYHKCNVSNNLNCQIYERVKHHTFKKDYYLYIWDCITGKCDKNSSIYDKECNGRNTWNYNLSPVSIQKNTIQIESVKYGFGDYRELQEDANECVVKACSHLYTPLKPYGQAIKINKKELSKLDRNKFVVQPILRNKHGEELNVYVWKNLYTGGDIHLIGVIIQHDTTKTINRKFNSLKRMEIIKLEDYLTRQQIGNLRLYCRDIHFDFGRIELIKDEIRGWCVIDMNDSPGYGELTNIMAPVLAVMFTLMEAYPCDYSSFETYYQRHDDAFMDFARLDYFNRNILNINGNRENEYIFNLIKDCPKNSIVLDIGAYNGDTAIYLARRLNAIQRNDVSIVCFEPNNNHCNMIAMCAKTETLNIKVIENIISDKEQVLYRKRDEGAGTMYDTCYESSVKYVSKTLDSFGINGVYFAKIDVEGHEPEVLRGGKETLKQAKLIYVEMWNDVHFIRRHINKVNGSHTKRILEAIDGISQKLYPLQKIEKNVLFEKKGT